MIKIVTDSSIDRPRNISNTRKKSIYPAHTVPLSFEIGGKHYQDGSVTTGQFLKLIKNDWPTTSTPNPESFARVFREIISRGDQVLCIPISQGLSSTIDQAVLGAVDFPDDVLVIDSKSVSLGIYYLVEYAKELIEKSLSLKEIAKELEKKTHDIKSFVLVKDLENLRRGGRISHIQYMIATSLHIKPLLLMDSEGKLQKVSRERTWKKAKQDMIKKILSLPNISRGGVIHVQNLEEATEMAGSLEAATGIKFDISETGPVIATHTGKGALGVVVELKDSS